MGVLLLSEIANKGEPHPDERREVGKGVRRMHSVWCALEFEVLLGYLWGMSCRQKLK